MLNRKAQSGGAAAGLVAIIAFMIVLYILLLPADVRTDLIGGTSSSDSSSSTKVSSNTLLFEHPQTLDPEQNTDLEKVLDSFSLYAEKSAKVIGSEQAVFVQNAWFKQREFNFTFSVPDAANTENYVLAFDVSAAQGNLVVELNGREIYNAEVSEGNADPIKIRAQDIGAENSIIFKASGVGLAFWQVNEFDLRNVRVIADYTDVSKRSYKNFFVISATEKQNFEKTRLTFVPECLTPRLVGPLTLSVNDKQLPYSAVPDCGTLSSIEFDPAYLKQGENVIAFTAEEGSYFIDRVAVKAELKEANFPIYYFELAQKDFDKVQNKTANVTLQFEFADKNDKVGEINVNSHLSRLDTDNVTYVKNINVFVENGQNYIQIRPINTLNIVDLKVILKK